MCASSTIWYNGKKQQALFKEVLILLAHRAYSEYRPVLVEAFSFDVFLQLRCFWALSLENSGILLSVKEVYRSVQTTSEGINLGQVEIVSEG